METLAPDAVQRVRAPARTGLTDCLVWDHLNRLLVVDRGRLRTENDPPVSTVSGLRIGHCRFVITVLVTLSSSQCLSPFRHHRACHGDQHQHLAAIGPRNKSGDDDGACHNSISPDAVQPANSVCRVVTASAAAASANSRRNRAPSCGPANRPRRISPAAGRGGICCQPTRRAAPA